MNTLHYRSQLCLIQFNIVRLCKYIGAQLPIQPSQPLALFMVPCSIPPGFKCQCTGIFSLPQAFSLRFQIGDQLWYPVSGKQATETDEISLDTRFNDAFQVEGTIYAWH